MGNVVLGGVIRLVGGGGWVVMEVMGGVRMWGVTGVGGGVGLCRYGSKRWERVGGGAVGSGWVCERGSGGDRGRGRVGGVGGCGWGGMRGRGRKGAGGWGWGLGGGGGGSC